MITRFLACLLALMLAAPRLWASVPDNIAIEYELFREGLRIATVKESFEKQGNGYRIVNESTPLGLLAAFIRTRIRIQSTGAITASGLRPVNFEYARLDDPGKSVRASFDWPNNRLRLSFDGRDETVTLPPRTQDRLSLMYQFMFLPTDRLKELSVDMTDGKRIEDYRYRNAGRVVIDTPLGRLNTFHYVKVREGDDKNQSEVWLDEERGFVPVKLLIIESDGTRYEQLVIRIESK